MSKCDLVWILEPWCNIDGIMRCIKDDITEGPGVKCTVRDWHKYQVYVRSETLRWHGDSPKLRLVKGSSNKHDEHNQNQTNLKNQRFKGSVSICTRERNAQAKSLLLPSSVNVIK